MLPTIDSRICGHACLVGPAEDLFYSIRGITYKQLAEKLRLRYETSEQTEKYRLELRYRRKETLQQLAGAVEKLTQLAYPSADIATRNILARDGFIDALDDRHLQIDIRRQNPTSLYAALTMAMELDVLNRGPVRNNDGSRPRHLRATSALEERQALDESAAPVKSSAESTRRTGGQRSGRASNNGKNNARGSSSVHVL